MDLSNLSREELEARYRDNIYRFRIIWTTILSYGILHIIFPEMKHGGTANISTAIIFLIMWGIYVFRYMPLPEEVDEINK